MSKPFSWLEGWDAELIHNEPIRVVGIDLGTTVSTVTEVFWTPGSDQAPVATVKEIPQPILNSPAKISDLVPSVVALVNGEEFVGAGAQILRGTQSVDLKFGKDLWAETKNVIGTRQTYPQAPDGYKTPKDIAAKILKFLIEAVKLDDPTNIDRVVITVPASFQATQRKDTIEAAEDAGIEVHSGDLMDEPVAAFLDFMVQHPQFAESLQGFQRFMVVDFGGGTCDVALLQVRRDPQGGALKIFRKGVSRFHRIGGADIDQVIVHKVLIPQIIEQNNIDPRDLNYNIKKRVIEPVLMGTAEILKRKMSDVVTQRIKLGTFIEHDPVLVVNLPNTIKIQTNNPVLGELQLANPTLKLTDLEQVTDPYFDPNFVVGKQDEYTTVQSIFAPIKDVLGRAEWSRDQIDQVLLVGGSAQYFGVINAIREFIPNAQNYLTYESAQDFQRCVGRGAAYQAMLLTAFGKSPLEATLSGDIKLLVKKGNDTKYETVVPSGVTLPFPADGSWSTTGGFSLNKASEADDVPLVISLQFDGKELKTDQATVVAPSQPGSAITVKIRIDANQHIEFSADIATQPPQSISSIEVDNPFSVVANPNEDRDQIMAIEESLVELSASEQRLKVLELAEIHKRLGEYEKARHYLEGVLAQPNQNTEQQINVLHRLGMVCGDMHDQDAQIEYYKKGLEIRFIAGSAFNLAMTMRDKKEYEKALEFVQMVFDHNEEDGTDYSLLCSIYRGMNKVAEAKEAAQKCVDSFPEESLEEETEFNLKWLRYSAVFLKYDDLVSKIDLILKGRKTGASEKQKEAKAEDFLPHMGA